MKKIFFLFSIVFFGLSLGLSAQEPMVFIYDASGSMWGKMEDQTKVEIARDVLAQSVDGLPEEQPVGLVAYGHRREKDCTDVEWLLGLDNTNRDSLKTLINGIAPKGRTPLARSAKTVLVDLKSKAQKATIILITDGIESCEGDICEEIKNARADGIDFKLHIVGFGLTDEDRSQLQCAAKEGDGYYFDAKNAQDLTDALNQATDMTVEQPDANFSIFTSKNQKPIDSYIKCKINEEDALVLRTYRDTVSGYLAPGDYTIVVNPLEDSDLSPQTLQVSIPDSGQVFEDVGFDSGVLALLGNLNGSGWDCMIKVMNSETQEVVASTRTYGREKVLDIDPGTYNVSMTALRINGPAAKVSMEDINVPSGDTTRVTHDFSTGKLRVGSNGNQGLIDATVKVNDAKSDKRIDGGRTYSSPSSNPSEYLLSPGTYTVVLKALPIVGYDADVTIEDVEVKAEDVTEVMHTFEFGELEVKVSNHYGLSDATVKVMDSKGERIFTSGRTYTSESSNPKDFLLSPGAYKIEVKEIGKDASGKQIFDVEIENGQTISKEVKF